MLRWERLLAKPGIRKKNGKAKPNFHPFTGVRRRKKIGLKWGYTKRILLNISYIFIDSMPR
jgi:hypothetical protein